MFYVYILHSFKDGGLYTGYTPDLKSRLKAHLGGFVRSTKPRLPIKLIHYEAFFEEKDAKQREVYLKGGNGKKELEVMLVEYFRKNPWQKNKDIDEYIQEIIPTKPPDALICPICNGSKEAPTKSTFTSSGKRAGSMVAICLTCKGRGWITKQQTQEAGDSL